MDHQEARREGGTAVRTRLASEGHRRGAKGQGKAVGEDAQGTIGDEETSYAQHAGSDPRVEAEGPWSWMEEVAEREGKEIEPIHAYEAGVKKCLLDGCKRCVYLCVTGFQHLSRSSGMKHFRLISYHIISYGNLLYKMLHKKLITIDDRGVISAGYPTDSNLQCKLRSRCFDIAPIT